MRKTQIRSSKITSVFAVFALVHILGFSCKNMIDYEKDIRVNSIDGFHFNHAVLNK
jgi:hypothetical protein